MPEPFSRFDMFTSEAGLTFKWAGLAESDPPCITREMIKGQANQYGIGHILVLKYGYAVGPDLAFFLLSETIALAFNKACSPTP